MGKEVAEPVEVILSANGGRIEGTVEATDKTSSTVRVSLIPEGSRRDNLLLYRRASLVQGRFVLTNIPPGNYKLYAWEDLPAGADENSEFMSTHETRGRAVTLERVSPYPISPCRLFAGRRFNQRELPINSQGRDLGRLCAVSMQAMVRRDRFPLKIQLSATC